MGFEGVWGLVGWRLQDYLDAIVDMREYDVPFIVRVAIDKGIRVGLWYAITAAQGGHVTVTERKVGRLPLSPSLPPLLPSFLLPSRLFPPQLPSDNSFPLPSFLTCFPSLPFSLRPLIHSLIHSFVHACMHSFFISFIQSINQYFMHSFVHSFV